MSAKRDEILRRNAQMTAKMSGGETVSECQANTFMNSIQFKLAKRIISSAVVFAFLFTTLGQEAALAHDAKKHAVRIPAAANSGKAREALEDALDFDKSKFAMTENASELVLRQIIDYFEEEPIVTGKDNSDYSVTVDHNSGDNSKVVLLIGNGESVMSLDNEPGKIELFLDHDAEKDIYTLSYDAKMYEYSGKGILKEILISVLDFMPENLVFSFEAGEEESVALLDENYSKDQVLVVDSQDSANMLLTHLCNAAGFTEQRVRFNKTTGRYHIQSVRPGCGALFAKEFAIKEAVSLEFIDDKTPLKTLLSDLGVDIKDIILHDFDEEGIEDEFGLEYFEVQDTLNLQRIFSEIFFDSVQSQEFSQAKLYP